MSGALAEAPYKCEHCGGDDFEFETVDIDRTYLAQHVLHQGRSPPSGQPVLGRQRVGVFILMR